MNQSQLEAKTCNRRQGRENACERASESGFVWVLLLIGRESGANFFNQSQNEVKQNQSKTPITFNSQLKTVLLVTLNPLTTNLQISFRNVHWKIGSKLVLRRTATLLQRQKAGKTEFCKPFLLFTWVFSPIWSLLHSVPFNIKLPDSNSASRSVAWPLLSRDTLFMFNLRDTLFTSKVVTRPFLRNVVFKFPLRDSTSTSRAITWASLRNDVFLFNVRDWNSTSWAVTRSVKSS